MVNDHLKDHPNAFVRHAYEEQNRDRSRPDLTGITNENLRTALVLISEGKRVIPIDANDQPLTFRRDVPEADLWDDATDDPQEAHLYWGHIWPNAGVGVIEKPKESES